MEALLVLISILSLVGFLFALALYVRLWEVLGAHRRAMNSLSSRLEQDRLHAQQASVLGYVPGQENPGMRYDR